MATTKLYAYVDETGQDTKGVWFLVGVVIVDRKARDALLSRLEEVERQCGKRKSPWRSTRPDRQEAYLDRVLGDPRLDGALFYAVHRDTMEYGEATLQTVAWALDERQASRDYRVVVIIDGLSKHEAARVGVGLRRREIPVDKVRGARDQSSALTRLADALCGFARDAEQGHAGRRARLMAAGSAIRRLQPIVARSRLQKNETPVAFRRGGSA
jgi:hypothetical protein